MKFKILLPSLLLLILLLSGCGALPGVAPTPLPTVVLGSNTPAASATPGSATNNVPAQGGGGGVTASGNVAPARQAQIASGAGGNVQAVLIAEGDKVKAGQVLVRFAGSEKLAAAVEAANVQLLTAQQAVKALNDNADQARSAAQLRLAKAQKALDDAQKRRTWKQYRNGSQTSIDAARADVSLAKRALEDAQKIYNSVADRADDDPNKAGPLSALAAAQKAYDKAVANLNYLLAMPNELDVNQAEAELLSAQTEYNAALVQVEKLKNGPDPDALALAQAQVKNAQAQLAASQSALDDVELKAPFAGTVSKVSVNSGEWVIPGQPILVLADVDNLRVETTDLSERDVPRVSVGQPVTVLVKALDQQIKGRVIDISPLADTLGGDVVYKTTIALDTHPQGLRAGMSVDVRFGE